jgi:hypothetical protein
MSHKTNLSLALILLSISTVQAQEIERKTKSGAIIRTYSLDKFYALEASDPDDRSHGIPGEYMKEQALKGLKQEDFAAMDYSDARLKTAWIRVVPGNVGLPFDVEDLNGPWTARYFETSTETHWGYAYLDLVRRGEATVPHIIALAQELQGTQEEIVLMASLPSRFGEKYRQLSLDFFRKYIKERPKSPYMTDAVGYLELEGNAEDAELMKWIGSIRPRYTQWMQESVGHLQKRLAYEAANPNTPKKRGLPRRPPFPPPNTQPSVAAPAPIASTAPVSNTSLISIIIVTVAALGLLCLLVKKRK